MTDTHMTATLQFVPHSRRPRAARANHHHIRDRQRRLLFRDPTLDIFLRVGTDVLLHHHHVLHQDLALDGKNTQHPSGLAVVAAGDDLHLVIALYIKSNMHLQPSAIYRCPFALQHFGREGNNLQKLLFAELPSHRTEHASSDRLTGLIDKDPSILVNPTVGPIAPPIPFALSHDPTLN